MSQYPGAARAGVSPNRSPRLGKVRLFIVHHYAGTTDPESAWNRFNSPNDRSVSPNYQVNADGSVYEVVPPDNFRAWTTGAIDQQAVTCETQNMTGAPSWGISGASREAIAHLIAWASKRYGFPIQRGRVADGNVVTVPGVVGHNETPAGRQTSTSCPGPSMNLDWIIQRAQQIAGGSPAGGNEEPAPAPEEEEDDMPKNSGFYYPLASDPNTFVNLIVNTGSGFYHEYGDGPGKGPTSGAYNNPVAEAFDTGSFAKITESHARVIKAACDRVLSGSGSADKIAAAILELDDDEDPTPLA